MKVLIASDYNSTNSYVKNIADALTDNCEIVVDASSFWSSNLSFDVIHIQWPEELFTWRKISLKDLENLKKRLNYWKSKGTSLVATLHNARPHRNDELDLDLYNLVYNFVDGVIHLGSFSFNHIFQKSGIKTIISHPEYSDLSVELDQSESRRKLGLPLKGELIVSVGKIRNDEEEAVLIQSFKKIKNKNLFLIICNSKSATPPVFKSNPVRRVVWQFTYLIKKIKFKASRVIFSESNINNEMLAQFVSAADFILSPRLQTLNSGVIFLGFTFSKPVIGPAIGNMKEVLDSAGCFTFDPKQAPHSLTNALEKTFQNKNAIVESVKKFTSLNCKALKVGAEHFKFYQLVRGSKSSH